MKPSIPCHNELPIELSEARIWCAWDGSKESYKVPLGLNGKPTDVQNSNPALTLGQATKLAEKVNGGVGICLYGTPYAAIDGDSAYTKSGKVKEWAEPVVVRAIADNLYIETSPSGLGFHAIGIAPEHERLGRTNTRRPNVKKEGIETFVGRGYLTVTGDSLLGPPSKLGNAGAAIVAARKVASDWGVNKDMPPSVVSLDISLNADATAPADFMELIETDTNLKSTWDGSRSDLASASEYDLALASLAAGYNWSMQAAWNLVIAGRKKRGDDITKTLRGDYAARTLSKAYSGIGESQAINPHGIALSDLWAYLPQSRYIHRPSRELWGPQGVTTVLPTSCVPGGLKATTWLNRNRHVEQMTWAPGKPEIIEGAYIQEGGWTPHDGARVYNLYRPARAAENGDANKAGPWLKLLSKLFPDEVEDLLKWMAHRVQHPEEKVNHAVVLGGPQGIGKDTLLHPLSRAVGSWNFIEVSPQQIIGQFNGFVKSVVLRVSEAHDLGDMKKFSFYDHTKTLTASPPETIRVNEKHKPEQQVPNLCGVIITTNHADGLYLPPEDRRHLVCWAKADKDDFSEDFWIKFWKWYEQGGTEHVCTFLNEYHLEGFDPKAPPRKTNAFRAMVETGQPSEQNDFADALEKLNWPDAVTFNQVSNAADPGSEVSMWVGDRKSAWMIKKRFTANGYELIANEGSDARWMVAGKRTSIYAKTGLQLKEQYTAVNELRAKAVTE